MDDIPEWAEKRACELVNARRFPGSMLHEPRHVTPDYSALYALALHVMKHEEPPVDPLLLEARKIVADIYEGLGCDETVDNVRNGAHDNGWSVTVVLKALKRGIELAKEGVV